MNARGDDARPPRLWTVREVATVLRVSERTVYRLLGVELARVKVGGTTRVPARSVLDYVARQQNGHDPDATAPPDPAGPGAA